MSGRPRDPALEQRLLAASWSLLTEDSYASLTLAQVAARAGAHRTDVYRRWSSKAGLVADTLAAHLPPVSDFDTGSLLSDIRVYVDDLARSWAAPWMDSLVAWLADLADDADAEVAFRSLSVRRGRALRLALDRAIERGEIAGLPDLQLVGDLLEGPLMHRRMIGRRPPTADFLDSVASSGYRVIMASAVTR
ncbi:MAG: TetR/AcrR family transcriptional regulator [Pseudonocardiaceae bacterium]